MTGGRGRWWGRALCCLRVGLCARGCCHNEVMTNFIFIALSSAHLAVLAQLESGNDPRAVGAAGEITAYQVCPAVLHENGFCPADVDGARAAALVVQIIWQRRVNAFEIAQQRSARVEELYLLWHRPARVLTPKAVERARALRFKNLLAEYSKSKNGKDGLK